MERKRNQPHQSSTRGEKEDKQMDGRTTWLCPHYCFKVVY